MKTNGDVCRIPEADRQRVVKVCQKHVRACTKKIMAELAKTYHGDEMADEVRECLIAMSTCFLGEAKRYFELTGIDTSGMIFILTEMEER